jgi:hypothetical protein
MELACFDEHSYQLALQAYHIAFLDFKNEPPSFVSMEIGTSSKVLVTPFVVQSYSKSTKNLMWHPQYLDVKCFTSVSHHHEVCFDF